MVDDLIRLKPPEMATCWLNICCNLASSEPSPGRYTFDMHHRGLNDIARSDQVPQLGMEAVAPTALD